MPSILQRMRRASSADSVRAAMLAGSGGIVVTAVAQVLSVPLFVSQLGVASYADWLVLAAIPTYLTLSDFGLGSAVATEATMRNAQGAVAEAARLFKAGWRCLLAGTLIVELVVIVFVTQTDVKQYLPASSTSGSDVQIILVLLGANALISLHGSYFEGGYRSTGRYANGIAGLNVIRLCEFAGLCVAIFATHSLVGCAVGMLAGRALSTITYAHLMAKRAKYRLLARLPAQSYAQMRQLIAPSLGLLAMPLGNALVSQGMVLVIARLESPIAIVTFTTVRIATSIIRQLNNVVNHGMQAQLTKLLALSDQVRAYRLMRRGGNLSIALVAVSCTVLIVCGPTGVSLWTAGKVEPSYGFVALMALTTAADSIWLLLMMTAYATNSHSWLAWAYLLSTIASVLLAAVTVQSIGLNGVPIALFLTDLVMTPATLIFNLKLRRSRRDYVQAGCGVSL